MNTYIAALIRSLGAETGTQRRHAALALGAAKDPSVAPALVAALRAEADGRVREDLTWALVQYAAEAEADLIAWLTSDNPNDRRTAAHVLSKVGNPDHFEHVRPLVADEHVDVAIKAYRAAANTGGASAAEALAERLGDGDHLQRDALSFAFQSLGGGGVPALIAALSSGDARVREHAAEAIGQVGWPRG